MIILAIDLGKFNSMCCFYDTATHKYRFQTVETTRSYLTTVFQNHKIDLVVMEACGPSAWISDLCGVHPTQHACDKCGHGARLHEYVLFG